MGRKSQSPEYYPGHNKKSAVYSNRLELAEAMRRSSSVAQQAGVSFENLAAYVTVASSVTRRSASTIGEAWKTILTRMGDIKAGAFDEEGMDINQVETALRTIDVQLRDSSGTFREFDDVLDDVGKKWDTLTTMEQNYVAAALGGTRQRNILLAVMSNYNEVSKDHISVEGALREQMESNGLASDRYKIYLESLEAAQNKMTVAWQEMWETTIKADWVKSFYNQSAAIMDFVTGVGGLQTVLLAIIPIIVAFNQTWTKAGIAYAAKEIPLLIGSIKKLTSVQAVFNAVASANPYVWIPIVLAGLVLVIGSMETAEEKTNRLTQEISSIQDEISSLRDETKSINSLSNEYENLKNKISPTAEETERLLEVQNKLKDLIPSLSGSYDKYGNFLLDSSNNMEELNKETLEQIRLKQELLQLTKDEMAESQATALVQSWADMQHSKRNVFSDEDDVKRKTLEFEKSMAEAKVNFSQMSRDAQLTFIEALRFEDNGSQFVKVFEAMMEQASKSASETASSSRWNAIAKSYGFPPPEELYEVSGEYKGIASVVKELNSEFSDLNDLMQKSIEGTLEFNDLENLPADYIDALEVENGKISLNISLLKEKQLEILKTKLAQVEAAEEAGTATQEEVELIKVQIEALEQQASLTHGVFQQTAWDNESLLWNLAKTAEQAGYSFQDAEGNALNSAQSIYEYMSMGNSEFNSFVEQLALKTGLSTQEIMNTINAMISQTASNASALVNYLGSTSLGVDSGFNRSPTAAPSISALNFKKLFPSSGASRGGGGAGGGKSPEQIRLEKEKKAIENRKKALQDNLDEYKKYIEAQKESLRLQKEEKEFSDELLEKNKSLAKLKSEIAILALDDSEEAKAKRLKLEEDAANLETEIVKDAEDRKYELQMEALDKAQKDYEDKISAQIDLLDTKISKIEEESSAIGSLGGGYSSLGNTAQSVVQTQIMPALRGMENLTKAQITSVQDYINKWLSAGLTIEQVIKNAQNLVNSFEGDFPKTISPSPRSKEIKPYHDGGFVGDLKANETFAKLLDGEYVATEGQMKNFVKTILPRIVLSGQNSDLFSSNGIGKGLQINFNVAGNLDKTVVPKIEKMANEVVREINSAMKNRGFIRNTSLTSI